MDKYPTLMDIVNQMESVDELKSWAEYNYMLQNPIIQERIRQLQLVSTTLKLFSESESLIEWAIENTILHLPQVQKKLNDLLTCSWCQINFLTSKDRQKHENIFHDTLHSDFKVREPLLSEFQVRQPLPSTSLSCTWCGSVHTTMKELQEHEHLHQQIDQCVSDKTLPQNSLMQILDDNRHTWDVCQHWVNECNHESPTDILDLTETKLDSFSLSQNQPVENDIDHGLKENQTNTHITHIFTSNPTQTGRGEENLPYTIRQTGRRTFARNLATETIYRVKFREGWEGVKLKDVMNKVNTMFDDILSSTEAEPEDLSRVVMTSPSLLHPIIVPLEPRRNITTAKILSSIENVLNSDENVPLNQNFEIIVGNISVPKGSGRRVKITQLTGQNSSIAIKHSLLRIAEDDDNLCLPTAIGRTFVKLCALVSNEEWIRITKNDPDHFNATNKVIKHKVVTGSYLRHIKKVEKNAYRKKMALTLCEEANVPTHSPMTIDDVKYFEDILDVNIIVVSSKLGNRFCRVTNNPTRKNMYLYLVQTEDNKIGHFHGIGNLSGFFHLGYFCESCLKAYSVKGKHSCATTCEVCGSNNCKVGRDKMSCYNCFRTCRNAKCYETHVSKKDKRGRDVDKSTCDKTYQCKRCKKVLQREERSPSMHRCAEYKCKNCHQYQLGQHLCYQRHRDRHPKQAIRKYMFYDFESSQCDLSLQCEQKYQPGPPCEGSTCTTEIRCTKCRLCINCKDSKCGLSEHTINYCVLQSACQKCGVDKDDEVLGENSKCSYCGSRCSKCFRFSEEEFVEPCQNTCGHRQRVFKGDRVPFEFCDHIMSRHYRNTVLIAHNAKGFDSYPVLNAMIDQHCVRPDKIFYQGSKIMYMHIAHGLDLTFIDSLNFIGMKLSAIPKCFGLEELEKGFFPHLWNSRNHWRYHGPVPSPEYYMYDYMSAEDQASFEKWYREREKYPFDFQNEMYLYCRSDTDILRRGCLKFRKIMMDVTSTTNDKGERIEGIDPFDFVTIASTCQGIFRRLFLKETFQTQVTCLETWITHTCLSKYDRGQLMIKLPNEESTWTSREEAKDRYRIGQTIFVKSDIALVPSEGYSTDTFSKSSIRWLEWVMEKSRRQGDKPPIKIEHGLNGRERRVGPYRLDGFDEEHETVYEFLESMNLQTNYDKKGCVFHGCPECFPDDLAKTKHPITQHSMQQLYYLTKRREAYLRKLGLRYICIWEHEFLKEIKENTDMNNYVSTLDIVDRLHPRDSFFGGRTNAIKLYHEVQKEGETIEYFDYTSLYPYVNKYAKYPVGHPTIITSDFEEINNYFGLAKVKILPPKNLYHPVLPYLTNGKLTFPLCKRCVELEIQEDCACDDDERCLIGTWCTPEITKSVSKGYTIQKIYEVYHFENCTQYDKTTGKGGLFSEYVNLFLRLKQQASGFPPECHTDEQKMEYIAMYAAKEGIHLIYDEIKKNPGLRSLAKICLNSFWGKFGQRIVFSQSDFFYNTEIDKFFRYLTDPRIEVRDFHIVSDNIIQLEHLDNPSFPPMDFKTNVFIATFTTMWARLKLYELLEITGQQCLYFDTDSIVFVDQDKQISNRLPIGNFLGELTNEVSSEDGHITHFVSSGPKSYAYKTLSNKEVCKVRGFSLTSRSNSQLINFSTMKNIVVDKSVESITVINPRKISRCARKRKLYNRIEEKEFKMVYTKRRLLNDLTTLPFGFKKS